MLRFWGVGMFFYAAVAPTTSCTDNRFDPLSKAGDHGRLQFQDLLRALVIRGQMPMKAVEQQAATASTPKNEEPRLGARTS